VSKLRLKHVCGVYLDINEASPRFAWVRKPGGKPGIAINTAMFTAGIPVSLLEEVVNNLEKLGCPR